MTRTRVIFCRDWSRYPYHVERYDGTFFWIFEDWTRLDIFPNEHEAVAYAKKYVEEHRTLPDHKTVVETYDEEDLLADKLKGLR